MKSTNEAVCPITGLGLRLLLAINVGTKELLSIAEKLLNRRAVAVAVAPAINETIFVTGYLKALLAYRLKHPRVGSEFTEHLNLHCCR